MGTRVRLRDVSRHYEAAEESAAVTALSGVSLEIEPGDFAILMGPSGSGKSTLLNLIGAVDRPTSGQLYLDAVETSALSESRLTLLRRHSLGFIFQFFNLVPTLNVRENVGFPLSLANKSSSEIATRVDAVLDQLGLMHRATHFPSQLSGGEMQRAAIGRAIVHRPPLILADEPTGNLDSATGESILGLVREVHQLYGPTIVMATHSARAASLGDYIVEVVDGTVSRNAGVTSP